MPHQPYVPCRPLSESCNYHLAATARQPVYAIPGVRRNMVQYRRNKPHAPTAGTPCRRAGFPRRLPTRAYDALALARKYLPVICSLSCPIPLRLSPRQLMPADIQWDTVRAPESQFLLQPCKTAFLCHPRGKCHAFKVDPLLLCLHPAVFLSLRLPHPDNSECPP